MVNTLMTVNGVKPLINGVLFQAVWFACLLGGNLWALVATTLYLLVHHYYFMRDRTEWRLLAVFVLLGVILDGALFDFGVFSANQDMFWMRGLPPAWLLCLWLCVGTLFAHSLAFLRGRYWLSAGMGAIGPTLSYYTGAKIADISLAEPIWQSLMAVALIWSLVVPFGVYLVEKWRLFEARDRRL